jgi:pSer/pThr/pTyr-binding forkhead associated (FHA) protein
MAKLIFNGEKFGGRVYELAATRTTVGRSNVNTLSVRDGSVSEQHCEIYDNGEDLIVRDLGSTNGTYLNGQLLRNAQGPLAHGGTIKFGAIEARVEMLSTCSAGDTATDVTAVHAYARHKNSPPPPAPTPTVLQASPLQDSCDNTMIMLSASSTGATATSPDLVESPAPRSKRSWLFLLAGIGLAATLGWLLLR